MFPRLATRWLSLEHNRGEESTTELYLWSACDIWAHARQDQTLDVRRLSASRPASNDHPWFTRGVGVNDTAPTPFQSLTPSRWTTFQEGHPMSECVRLLVYSCFPWVGGRGVVNLFVAKQHRKRQNPVFSTLTSQSVHTLCWN